VWWAWAQAYSTDRGLTVTPPLVHQAEVFAVAGEFSLGGEVFSAAAVILWWVSWPQRSRRLMESRRGFVP
jgi:hypothetical protein